MPLRKLAEAFLQGRPPADRRVAVGAERALRSVVVLDHPSERVGVAPGELGEFVACAVEASPLGQPSPVRKGDVHHRIRVHVLESVRAELQLVVAQRRACLNEVVRGRARVVEEAGQRQLLGRGIAAHDRPRVEHAALVARTREIRGGDERVVSAARDDDVEGLAHCAPSSQCARPSGTRATVIR